MVGVPVVEYRPLAVTRTRVPTRRMLAGNVAVLLNAVTAAVFAIADELAMAE